MNRIFGKLILVAPLALAVCAAYAQQTPPSGTQDTQAPPQGTQGSQGNMGAPQTPPQTAPQNPPYQSTPTNPAGSNQTAPMSNGTNGAATPFDSLDTSHQGYLTRQNAATDSWLASHFSQCDADRDGRVTRAEYTACSRAHP